MCGAAVLCCSPKLAQVELITGKVDDESARVELIHVAGGLRSSSDKCGTRGEHGKSARADLIKGEGPSQISSIRAD